MHTKEIVEQVIVAQQDVRLSDEFIKQYMPFIKSETAKFIKHSPIEGEDDELSIAMFAFYEAIQNYKTIRGAFLNYAALTIRHRLIDYYRKEQKNRGVVSLDTPIDLEEEATLMDTISSEDNAEELQIREATKEEIQLFSKDLEQFGITLTEVAQNCPKQERTLNTCLDALDYARMHPEILRELVATKKLPISKLAGDSKIIKKKLERHRKYMVAILLAYTNGFEIIRGHLCQIGRKEGGNTCDI